MTSRLPCEDLAALADGELAAPAAARVRRHLGGCARCQAELHDLLQLEALADRLGELPLPQEDDPVVDLAQRRSRTGRGRAARPQPA
jgi:anti-sigma factor RsiW